MEQVHSLLPVILLLFAGVVAIAVMRPLGMNPIVGYLLAGVLIGQYGLGLIKESETTHLLAELGVVFLLFDIGLHFSLAHIWRARKDILGLGPMQMLLCTAAFVPFLLLLDMGLGVAVLVAATLALSSTAVAVQTLADYGQQHCPVGSSATAVLIFQDVCAIFLLILAVSLSDKGASLGSTITLAMAKSIAAFIAAILIGRYLIGPLFRIIAKSKREEVFTATALLIVLATAAATGGMGLSLTLGAFLGGMIISETAYRHVVQTEVKPFRGLFLGFFFITVGMSLNLNVLVDEWPKVLAALTLLIVIKTLFIYIAAKILRTSQQSAIQLGFLLSQGSEFAFVIFAIAAVNDALGANLSAVLITAVAASMALTTPLVALGHKMAEKWADKNWDEKVGHELDPKTETSPIVIIGMDTVGRLVADAMDDFGLKYFSIEMDHERFLKANTDGYPVAFGDLADFRMMETIEMSRVSTVVITIARYQVTRELTPLVDQRYPNLQRFVSVDSEEDKIKFEALGFTANIARSFPKGIDTASVVLLAHGIESKKIQEWMQRQQGRALDVRGEDDAPFAPVKD